jgi:hypothetical protein
MTTSASSVMFTPHNFHDGDRARALTSGVMVDTSEPKGSRIRIFGPGRDEEVRRQLKGFKAREQAVRKRPVDEQVIAV